MGDFVKEGGRDPWLRPYLADIKAEQVRTREAVEKLGDEVRTTYAREKDCSDRAAQAGIARSEGVKRLWQNGVEPLRVAVDKLGKRVTALERSDERQGGAREAHRSYREWAAKIAASLLVTGLVGAAGWFLRGCI